MFSLVLVRHGETQHNKDRVIQGQLDVPLSTAGVEQALKLGEHFQHQVFTKAYSSDLCRARDTAARILECSPGNDGVNIIEDSRLRERAFGEIEGKPFKHLRDAASKANTNMHTFNPPGGETVQQLRKRAIAFFLDLCNSILRHNNNNNNSSTEEGAAPVVTGEAVVAAGDTSLQQQCPPASPEEHEHPTKRFRRDSSASTCDDMGGGNSDPYMLDSVLVVSHRGPISELIRYFVDDLGCPVPKCQVNRTCPNAAFSRFTVSWATGEIMPNVTCHQIHDRQHLYALTPSSASTPTRQEVKRNAVILENGVGSLLNSEPVFVSGKNGVASNKDGDALNSTANIGSKESTENKNSKQDDDRNKESSGSDEGVAVVTSSASSVVARPSVIVENHTTTAGAAITKNSTNNNSTTTCGSNDIHNRGEDNQSCRITNGDVHRKVEDRLQKGEDGGYL